ncbi:MAG: hypothetical protein AVDCRST_MAG65-1715, partial [uncultured Solirubrobacteraceae bacterium]
GFSCTSGPRAGTRRRKLTEPAGCQRDAALHDRLRHRRGHRPGHRDLARLEHRRPDRARRRPGLRLRVRADVGAARPRRPDARRDRPDRARHRHRLDHHHGARRQRDDAPRPRRDERRGVRHAHVADDGTGLRDRVPVRLRGEPVAAGAWQGPRGRAPVPPAL